MHSNREIEFRMSLTERERIILQLSGSGLSDYKIARKINTDPPSVTRSRKNAQKKLLDAITDLEWATKIGVSLSEFNTNNENSSTRQYSFFL
jgi:DNA-binding CsgD family transcriptional regulator